MNERGYALQEAEGEGALAGRQLAGLAGFGIKKS